MRLARLALVGALTVGVSALTLPLLAQEPPAPSAVGTPLQVRPSRPIELAPAPSSPRGTTAAALALVAVAGAAWVWRRKKALAETSRRPALVITARQTIGVRSELLVVEVGGQSLLLGVTPAGVQRLAVLSGLVERIEEPELEPEPELAEARPVAIPRPMPAPMGQRRKRPEPDRAPEEQVRGLLRARRST